MQSSESHPGCVASTPEDVPGGAKTVTSKVLDTSAGLIQSLKPIKQFQQVRVSLLSLSVFMARITLAVVRCLLLNGVLQMWILVLRLLIVLYVTTDQ